jgi:hypothetical protein
MQIVAVAANYAQDKPQMSLFAGDRNYCKI